MPGHPAMSPGRRGDESQLMGMTKAVRLKLKLCKRTLSVASSVALVWSSSTNIPKSPSSGPKVERDEREEDAGGSVEAAESVVVEALGEEDVELAEQDGDPGEEDARRRRLQQLQ